MFNKDRPLIILQIEDTPSDAALTAEALKESDIPYTIRVVPDGKRALGFLKNAKGFEDAPRPDLILLDLDLPGLNGGEILRIIKNDEKLKIIPVIIFTTQGTEEVQRNAYENFANSFVVKPLDFAKFMETVQSIASYWFNTCGLEKSSAFR
jgi:CheY-like chemotaxis protein